MINPGSCAEENSQPAVHGACQWRKREEQPGDLYWTTVLKCQVVRVSGLPVFSQDPDILGHSEWELLWSQSLCYGP